MENFDASDKETVDKAEQDAKNARKTELKDLKELLATHSGRRILWRILERTGMHRTSFTGNSKTFFNEGERNIGLWLVDEVLLADADKYLLMIKENKKVGDEDA